MSAVPRQVTLVLDYLTLDDNLLLIEEPLRGICQRILADNRPLFEKARGSTYNHQTWDGGYIDHITDCLNYARHKYAFDAAFGRPLGFSLSDALGVLFAHDLEKPWRIEVDAEGNVRNRAGLETKEDFRRFRDEKLAEYGLTFTPEQQNAFINVEGEGARYSSKYREAHPLAAFCHEVDYWSARRCFDYPKPAGEDEWTGADRFRSN